MLTIKRIASGVFAVLLSISVINAEPTHPTIAEPFVPPAVASDETNVFVIRESGFVGGARGAWIAANDRVVADLSNGSHVMIKLKDGLNVVHGVQGLAGFGFIPIDHRAGQTVYVDLLYSKGVMKEITAEEAAPLIAKTKEVQPLAELRPNTALDDITINPSMLGFQIMDSSDAVLEPDESSAVITFLRQGKLIKDVPFDIWNETDYVGSLKGGYYFDVRVSPGTHTFISKSEHYSVLKADVAAGKHYYVELEVDTGWNQAHLKLLPLDLKKDAAKIEGLGKLVHTSLNASKLDMDTVKPRIQAGNNYLVDARQQIADGKLPIRELLAEQGR